MEERKKILASEVKEAHLEKYKDTMSTNFKALRDVSQDQLAEEMGLTKSRISQLERGNCTPSFAELVAYHDRFKVPYEYLFGESTSRHYENQTISKELGLSDDAIYKLKELNLERIKEEESLNDNGNSLRIVEASPKIKALHELIENDHLLYLIGSYLYSDYELPDIYKEPTISEDEYTKSILEGSIRVFDKNTKTTHLYHLEDMMTMILVQIQSDLRKLRELKKEGESRGNHNTQEE